MAHGTTSHRSETAAGGGGTVAGPAAPARAGRRPAGTWLVAGLLALGVAAAVTGIWFQRHQTRRCLAFYGTAAARRITTSPRVELWLVGPAEATGSRRLAVLGRTDVSQAPGLVHLRRGLVEDANFSWEWPRGEWPRGEAAAADGAAAPLPLESWDVVLVFRGTALQSRPHAGRDGDDEVSMLAFDLDPTGGAVTVVGQPGRVGLGRIGPGLAKWIGATLADANPAAAGRVPPVSAPENGPAAPKRPEAKTAL